MTVMTSLKSDWGLFGSKRGDHIIISCTVNLNMEAMKKTSMKCQEGVDYYSPG